MTSASIWVSIAVMAGVTYLIRMLPLVLFRTKLEHPFLRSFLFYVPYAVLAAMTIPAVFESTGNVVSACAGLGVALFLAWRGASLLPVALFACAAAFVADSLCRLLLK